ncbi:hypothetical protein [Singulisphaera acidiphila]|uniref:Uncharacterized protein n=1 Tax=Singulisphaera acidiphila (strain ATCC BAA-1392 / DSM 18658 / VKM B-2454 / MOB10) TaxID=886293 RepID=L0DJ68_SINAD|nr:hypothetical protein [Singulisphaera acidiphila]AGA28875.1 hypothetical protein Sinac_4701 [Singulisphaera acidiphila DSM 18658]
MAVFRVPYPEDPERRQALFHRVATAMARHGRYEGTTEQGHFEGTTPLGKFAGSYRVVEGSPELEIELTKKPWLVSTHLLEREVRKMLAQA